MTEKATEINTYIIFSRSKKLSPANDLTGSNLANHVERRQQSPMNMIRDTLLFC
jgi:hypothetical protein